MSDVYVSPTRVPATIALLLAVLGIVGIWVDVVFAVPVVFGVGAVLVLAALVLAVVCLVRDLARYLAGLALLVALVPVATVIVQRVAAS